MIAIFFGKSTVVGQVSATKVDFSPNLKAIKASGERGFSGTELRMDGCLQSGVVNLCVLIRTLELAVGND